MYRALCNFKANKHKYLKGDEVKEGNFEQLIKEGLIEEVGKVVAASEPEVEGIVAEEAPVEISAEEFEAAEPHEVKNHHKKKAHKK